MNKTVSLLIKLAVFVVCMALVIVGQRNVGYEGLATQLVGLVGLLVLLYLYNRQYR